MSDAPTELSPEQQRLVEAARAKCFVLYEGARTPHRSCGIALAETFGLPHRPYQALRKGGITGAGECGSIVAGRLVLGEILGDPDPTGAVTPALAAAMADYARLWPLRLQRGAVQDSIACSALTGQFESFQSPARAAFCTRLAADVAALVAEVLLRHGHALGIEPIAGLDWSPPGGWPPSAEPRPAPQPQAEK